MVTQPKCHSFPLSSKLLWLIDYQVFLAHTRKRLSVKSATTKKPDCNYSFLVYKSQFCKVVKIDFSVSNIHDMNRSIYTLFMLLFFWRFFFFIEWTILSHTLFSYLFFSYLIFFMWTPTKDFNLDFNKKKSTSLLNSMFTPVCWVLSPRPEFLEANVTNKATTYHELHGEISSFCNI